MRLQDLLTDDEAVSPVIGVILMVAITVILAAVIASFVLGLGNQAQTVTPQASFAFEYENASGLGNFDGNVTVVHESGDTISAAEVFLRGEGIADSDDYPDNQTWAGYALSGTGNNGTISGNISEQRAIVAGDRVDVAASSDYELDVVWEASEGDASATLGSDEGPDAS